MVLNRHAVFAACRINTNRFNNACFEIMHVRDKIIELLSADKSYREIVAELGCTKSAVAYHAKKVAHVSKHQQHESVADTVIPLLQQGLSSAEVQKIAGVSEATVRKYKTRIGMEPANCRRYDWAAVQAYYDQGHTREECKDQFGFTDGAWGKAVIRGVIMPRNGGNPTLPLTAYLIENSTADRGNVKKRLIDEGYLANECSACGQGPTWNGKPLVLQLDHINGVNNDNRLENLRILCPNCHTQTETFSARNRRNS